MDKFQLNYNKNYQLVNVNNKNKNIIKIQIKNYQNIKITIIKKLIIKN